MVDEASTWGFPDTGAAFIRAGLLGALANRPQVVKVLAAPSGFGKTIVAAQFGRYGGFGQAIWVDAGGGAGAKDGLLKAVAVAFRDWSANESSSSRVAAQADLSDIMAALESFRGGGARLCVVVDDVAELSSSTACSDLITLERALRAVRACLVITTRESHAIEGLENVQYLDEEDLRLTKEEAIEIAAQPGSWSETPVEVESVWTASGGHAAFFVVLLRHSALRPSSADAGKQSLDLEGLLNRVVRAHLSLDDQRTLTAMGLMGGGTPDQLQAVGVNPAVVGRIARVLPLVTVSPDDRTSFRVHDILQASVLNRESTVGYPDDIAPRVVEQLVRRGEIDRALEIVARLYDDSATADWLECNGAEALAGGHVVPLRRMVSELSLRELIERPRLLLLQASLLFAHGSLDEAATKAKVVTSIAVNSGDRRLACDALRLTAAIQNDGAQMEACRQTLLDLAENYTEVMSPEEQAHAYASLGTVYMYAGKVNETSEWLVAAEAVLSTHNLGRSASAAALTSKGSCVSAVMGRHDEAIRFFTWVATAKEADRVTKTIAMGNAAAANCEIGRLDRALQYGQSALSSAGQLGFADLDSTFRPILGAARVGLGDVAGLREVSASVCGSKSDSFQSGVDHNRIYYSTLLRACGQPDESLSQAEMALEALQIEGMEFLGGLAQLEVSASMLALGDATSAGHLVAAALAGIDQLNMYQQLRAAMILAQIDILAGNPEDAAEKLRPFREYILTGSSNWQIAMYVRAFPELIAPIAAAVGVEDLPVRMLRMVLPENAERSMAATRELMPAPEWTALGKRLLGPDEFLKWIEREGRPLCRVKMFGGFEVSVGPRSISEKDWKKRKARALFAILASRNGHAITRDQLCDRLWSDMDDQRAKNNLYVAWSVMKSALVGPEAKGADCPYIEAVGGLCRTVDDVVRTDVDEFDRLVAEAKVAQTSGNRSGAIMAYERLADLYRGEVLPGDLYDDSFQAMRDRYRHEFCDAMLRGSDLALTVDDPGTALQFARRGLGSDPFREDLYQAALRAQISAGQRSAAIETYFECRSKLIDELGLDPSSETRALYDQVLALEERAMQPHRWGVWLSGEDPSANGPSDRPAKT